MDKQPSNRVAVIAIVCIAAMEMNAMWHGVNGVLLNVSMCLIAGIAGYKTKPEVVHKAIGKSADVLHKIVGFFRRKE